MLISLKRAIEIFWTIGRFRLDKLLSSAKIPFRYRILLGCFKLFPDKFSDNGRRLRFALEALGPIFVKFGQLLSTRPDLVPSEIVVELNQLQDNVTPFSSHLFKQQVAQALNQPITDLFNDFSEEPLASASIAQVHTATLPSGEAVIIKSIRPNIRKTILKDTNIKSG